MPPRCRRDRSRGPPAGRRRCPRSGRRRRARTARPSPPRPAPRAPGTAAGRGARSSGRACRACRRAAADGRAAAPGAVRSRSSRSSCDSSSRMEERAASLRRAAPHHAQLGPATPLRAADEEELRIRAGARPVREGSPSPGRRGRCRGARRGPRGLGTRPGSSGRPGSPFRRAAPRSPARRRSRSAYRSASGPGATTQITCPVPTGSPGATDSSRTTPALERVHLVLHLHRLDDTDHLSGALPNPPPRPRPRAPCPASG